MGTPCNYNCEICAAQPGENAAAHVGQAAATAQAKIGDLPGLAELQAMAAEQQAGNWPVVKMGVGDPSAPAAPTSEADFEEGSVPFRLSCFVQDGPHAVEESSPDYVPNPINAPAYDPSYATIGPVYKIDTQYYCDITYKTRAYVDAILKSYNNLSSISYHMRAEAIPQEKIFKAMWDAASQKWTYPDPVEYKLTHADNGSTFSVPPYVYVTIIDNSGTREIGYQINENWPTFSDDITAASEVLGKESFAYWDMLPDVQTTLQGCSPTDQTIRFKVPCKDVTVTAIYKPNKPTGVAGFTGKQPFQIVCTNTTFPAHNWDASACPPDYVTISDPYQQDGQADWLCDVTYRVTDFIVAMSSDVGLSHGKVSSDIPQEKTYTVTWDDASKMWKYTGQTEEYQVTCAPGNTAPLPFKLTVIDRVGTKESTRWAGDEVTVAAAEDVIRGEKFHHWELPDGLNSFLEGTSDETNPITFRMPAADTEITAIYKYRVMYKRGPYSETGSEQTDWRIPNTQPLTLRGAGLFTRTGYTQTGWLREGGGWRYDLNAEYTDDASLDLVPEWKADVNGNGKPDDAEERYRVVYTDGVEGVEVFADQTYANLLSGTDTPAFQGTPTRKGYVFGGWNPTVADKVTETVIYFAQWKADANGNGKPDDEEERYTVTEENRDSKPQCTLTFETNGGTQFDPLTKPYGEKVGLTGYVPAREGYVFDGWFADQKLTKRITEITLDGGKTVYAGWIAAAPAEQPAQSGADVAKIPQTGDGFDPALVIGLMLLSAAAMAVVGAKRARKRDEDTPFMG